MQGNETVRPFVGVMMLGIAMATDLVVSSTDVFATPPTQIRDVQLLRTMVGGRWVYEREAVTP